MNSDQVKVGFQRAPHRSLFMATGVKREDFSKPFIGVCNSYVSIIPGHCHLNKVGEWVKQNATSFTAVSYTDGSFGISGSLTKADLAPLFGITSESTSSSQSEMSEIYENLVLSKFSLGLVFSATGLEDLKFEFEASTSFGETDGYTVVDGSSESYVIDHTSAFEISANLSFDLAFLSGSEVVITFPTDLDAYTLVNSAQ